MKLLITGGAGFIGANFILYWMRNHPDDSVVNLDALTYAGNLENLKEVENNPHYSFVKGDICDPVVVEQAMAGCDIVAFEEIKESFVEAITERTFAYQI